ALQQENISYVVTPYGAHAQMIFSIVGKHVDVVITKDSDLIPFGCPRGAMGGKRGQIYVVSDSTDGDHVKPPPETLLLRFTDGLMGVTEGSTTVTNFYFTEPDKVMLLGHSDDFLANAGMHRFYDHVLGNSLNGAANLRQEAYARLSDKEGIEKAQ
ncbi:5'-3' exonuclease, C-terminal domain-containing protein, partial [Tanacetum coccineum]